MKGPFTLDINLNDFGMGNATKIREIVFNFCTTYKYALCKQRAQPKRKPLSNCCVVHFEYLT